jgi:hypothetical protein
MRTLSEGNGFAADGLAADLGISVTHEVARLRGEHDSNVLILKSVPPHSSPRETTSNQNVVKITRRTGQNNHDVIALSTCAEIV